MLHIIKGKSKADLNTNRLKLWSNTSDATRATWTTTLDDNKEYIKELREQKLLSS
jgi:hypothetical protein